MGVHVFVHIQSHRDTVAETITNHQGSKWPRLRSLPWRVNDHLRKFPVLTTQVKISNQSKDFEKPVVVFGQENPLKLTCPKP